MVIKKNVTAPWNLAEHIRYCARHGQLVPPIRTLCESSHSLLHHVFRRSYMFEGSFIESGDSICRLTQDKHRPRQLSLKSCSMPRWISHCSHRKKAHFLAMVMNNHHAILIVYPNKCTANSVHRTRQIPRAMAMDVVGHKSRPPILCFKEIKKLVTVTGYHRMAVAPGSFSFGNFAILSIARLRSRGKGFPRKGHRRDMVCK